MVGREVVEERVYEHTDLGCETAMIRVKSVNPGQVTFGTGKESLKCAFLRRRFWAGSRASLDVGAANANKYRLRRR